MGYLARETPHAKQSADKARKHLEIAQQIMGRDTARDLSLPSARYASDLELVWGPTLTKQAVQRTLEFYKAVEGMRQAQWQAKKDAVEALLKKAKRHAPYYGLAITGTAYDIFPRSGFLWASIDFTAEAMTSQEAQGILDDFMGSGWELKGKVGADKWNAEFEM